MATDPTRRITDQKIENALVVKARSIAERLADVQGSADDPVVTVTLDWRIEGTNPGRQPDDQHPDHQRDRRRSAPDQSEEERDEASARRRPARRVVVDQLDELVESYPEDSKARESVGRSVEQIVSYLDHDIDPSARGAYIVAHSGQDVFETVLFALPLPTTVSAGMTPRLTELVRLDEDNPTYAVLLADQREASLSVIAHGTLERSVQFEGSDYPRKQAQGGWSQRRFQARADERVEAFASDIADETRKVLNGEDIEALVLAGDEVMVPALEHAFHEEVAGKVIGTIRLDIRSSPSDVLQASMPVALRHERDQERTAVDRLNDGIGADTFGAGGAHKVLEALQAGQVQTLVMNADYSETGWADYAMPAYGAGDLPNSHPYGGNVSDLVTVNLEDEMVRLAIQSGSEVEIIHVQSPVEEGMYDDDMPDAGEATGRTEAATLLDEHGGVGAILRYVIGDEPSEEESAAQAQA